jgi:hypothetical protein
MRQKKFLNDREAGNTARGYQKSTPCSFFFFCYSSIHAN